MRTFIDNEQNEIEYRNHNDFVPLQDRLILKNNTLVFADNIIICKYCETIEHHPSTYDYLCQFCGGWLGLGWLFIGSLFGTNKTERVYVRHNLAEVISAYKG